MKNELLNLIFYSRVEDTTISLGLLALRISIGLLILFVHGLPKVFNFKIELEKIEDPFHLGPKVTLVITAFQEVVLSFFIIIGLATRISSLPLIATLAIAAFVVHRDWSLEKKQFIILYLIGFGTLAICGSGSFSLDSLILTYVSSQ